MKELLPIIQAFVDGKQIQFLRIEWEDIDKLTDDLFINPELYRIKPEPKYRPFKVAKECWQEMQKHQPFGWVKASHGYFNIIGIKNDGINFGVKDNWLDYAYLFTDYKFVDGSVFGIKDE
mgnify:CR=1 FL=1